MAKSYVVTGPLATPYREDGTRVYVYQGAPLPDGLREGEADRMVDLGLASESSASPKGDAGDEQPAGNASLEAWQQFARSQGASDEDLEGKSRDDLRDQFSK